MESIKDKFHYSILILIVLVFTSGCTKLVEVNQPATFINGDNVYESDATAAGVLTGLFTAMSNSTLSSGSVLSLSLFPGLSADELTLFNGSTNTAFIAYYKNSLSNNNITTYEFWPKIYQLIYVTNSAIEGLNNATGLTPAVKQQLLGEASTISIKME